MKQDKDFQFQGKSKRSYNGSMKITFLLGVFGVTSMIAFGMWTLINYIINQIQ
jgi:hypothetical protein